MPQWKPFTTQLTESLDQIEADGLELLDRSMISTRRHDPYSEIVVLGPANSFDDLDGDGARIQMGVLAAYRKWEEIYLLLEKRLPPRRQKESTAARKLLTTWLERSGERWSVPATVQEAKETGGVLQAVSTPADLLLTYAARRRSRRGTERFLVPHNNSQQVSNPPGLTAGSRRQAPQASR